MTFLQAKQIGAAVLVGLCWAPLGAAAQDAETRALLERLQRLERDLNTLQQAVYKGDAPARPAGAQGALPATGAGRLADAEVRMSRLETQIRTLTGSVEELRHGLSTLSGRLDKLITDVDFRLTEIEGRGAPATGSASAGTGAAVKPPAAAAGAGTGSAAGGQQTAAVPSVLPAGNAMEQYNYARSLLRKLDFPGAEGAFREFLELHPNDKLASNAHYWLGETYYSQGQLVDAARTFALGYQRFPDGNKAPDILLKLGITLRKMDEQEEACATLGELRRKFPDAAPPLRRRMEREIAEAGCA